MTATHIRHPIRALADTVQWLGDADAATGAFDGQQYIRIELRTDRNEETTALWGEIYFSFFGPHATGYLDAVRANGTRYRVYISGRYEIVKEKVDPDNFR